MHTVLPTIVYFLGVYYLLLTYLFSLETTIAKFIPEIAEAIYKVPFEEYLEVSEKSILVL